MSAELIQILLNTLEPNTEIVKDSQLKLEKCNPNPEFPLLLGQIICESQNHPKQLDLIAVVALAKCIKFNYKGHDQNIQAQICEMLLKLFEIVVNRKVINEIILMFRHIIIVEYPQGIAFQVILNNFKAEKLVNLAAPFRKFIFLKLFYKCIRGIHRENLKTPEVTEQFRNLLDVQASPCLTQLMSQLVQDLSQLCEQMDAIRKSNTENLESNLSELFSKLTDTSFFDTAKYIFKIYSFYNLISKYSPLGDFNVVILSRHFHQIYKSISDILISSGLINKIQSSKEVENVLTLIYVTEKHLMASVEQRITKAEDTEAIFDHFFSMYFSNNDQLVFFGEKFVNYNQLSNSQYLQMVCETEIFSKLKFYEEKLLTNCLNTLSCILVNFGYSPGEIESENTEEKAYFIAKVFIPKLETIFQKILDQILFIDVKDLYNLKVDPEEYYTSIEEGNDEDVYLREAARALFEHIADYIDDKILINLAQNIQNDLLNFSPEKIQGFKQILKRESNFFFFGKLYSKLKNDIDYDLLILQCLNVDLGVQDKNYDIVKIQLLRLIQSHVQRSYKLNEDFSKPVFEVVYSFISQKTSFNICLVLISLKIMIHLIETNFNFVSLIPEIAISTFELSKQVHNIDSKLLIFEFFEHTIVGNFPEYYSVIWEICETTYLSCKDTSANTISLKCKAIDILIKLIEVSEIEYQKVPFLVSIMEEGIRNDEGSEYVLLQDSFTLFGKLLTKLNLRDLPEQIIYKFVDIIQRVCTIAKDDFDNYCRPVILILETCMLSEIPVILQVIAKNLSEFLPMWFTDFKDEALNFFFDMTEIYLRIDKANRAEFSLHIIEQTLFYMKSSNEINIHFLMCLLRFLGRLAFEDVDALFSTLETLATKLGVSELKYTLLANFYALVKEETVYSSYYLKRSFCFYTFAILTSYLKELEAHEGINMNKLNLSEGNIFQTDFGAVIEVFCKCLSELYAYDSNQLEYVESEIYGNTLKILEEDDYLRSHEFDINSFLYLIKFFQDDPMRKFDIYSAVKNVFEKSSVIVNDPEIKSLVTREVKF